MVECKKHIDDTIPNDLLLSYCIRLWKVLWSRARENTDIKIFLVERKRIQQTFLKYTRTTRMLERYKREHIYREYIC